MLKPDNVSVSSLFSKLNPDRNPGSHLARANITERICNRNNARVTLVKAHAGFGKSTLLYEVYQQLLTSNIPCVWLTIDESDNDVFRFTYALASALVKMKGADVNNVSRLSEVSESSVAGSLLEKLTSISPPFALIIDDLEKLQSPSAFIVLRQVVKVLPKGAKLIIGSRSLPDLGLARLRSQGDLLEIGVNELRFSPQEISQFFAEYCNFPLDNSQVEEFYKNTEGWPVAVKLASIALQSASNKTEWFRGFAGANAMVSDYLSEEVFASLPLELRDFVLRSSVLSRQSADICDEICQIENSQAMLETLEKSNLFVVALDGERKYFRFHSLFSRFLQAQLNYHLPGEKTILHKKAARWYLTHHQIVPALEQAINSGDWDFSLPLLAQHVFNLLNNGRPRLVLRFIESIESQHILQWTELKVAHIWAVSFTRGAEEALTLLNLYERQGNQSEEFTYHAMALRPTLLSILDKHLEAYESAIKVFGKFPAKYSFAKDILSSSLAYVCLVLGKIKEAYYYLDSITCDEGQRSNFTLIYAQCVEGAIEYLDGQLRQAKARFQLVNQMARPNSSYATSGNAMAGVLLANVLYEQGDYTEAERLLHIYLPFLREQSVPDHLICGYRCQVRIDFSKGDIDHAHQTLVELEHTGYRNNLPRLVGSAHLERSRIALLQGEKETATMELKRARAACHWSQFTDLALLGSDIEQLDIGEIRWEIHFGTPFKAVARLKELLLESGQGHRNLRVLRLNTLLAVALKQNGKENEALRVMQKVANQAVAQGFVRLLLDEGSIVVQLLNKLAESGAIAIPEGTLANSIRCKTHNLTTGMQESEAALGMSGDESANPLTKKEIVVLNLLAEGLSNANIAERMFVSTNTVRTHLRNINTKLNTQSRTESVAVARKTGLIY